MTSTRIALILIAVIIILILILSNNRMTRGIRDSLQRLVPGGNRPTPTLTITPTPRHIPTLTPTPSKTGQVNGATTKGGIPIAQNPPNTKNIPSTGPESLVWMVLGGSSLLGVFLRKKRH